MFWTFSRSLPYFLALSIVLVFAVLNVRLFYPGIVTFDSLVMYRESLSGSYTDIRPPLLSFLWRFANYFVTGPIIPLFVNIFCYWFVFLLVFLVCAYATERPGRALASLPIGLFPFLLAFNGVIWSDVSMALAFGLSSVFALLGLVLRRRQKGASLVLCGVASIFLVLGAAIRHNALPSALILALVVGLAAPLSRARQAMLVILLWTVCVSAPSLIRLALQPQPAAPVAALATFDSIGATFFAPEEAPSTHPSIPRDVVAQCYSPRLWDACLQDPWLLKIKDLDTNKDGFAQIRHLIQYNTGSYIKHRALYYSYMLRFGCNNCTPYVWNDHSDENEFQFRFAPTTSYFWRLRALVFLLADSPVGRLYSWMAASILFAALALRSGDRLAVGTGLISLAGGSYLLLYAIIGIADDFRYAYWTLLAVIVAVTIYVLGSRTPFVRLMSFINWVLVPVILLCFVELFVRNTYPLDLTAPSNLSDQG